MTIRRFTIARICCDFFGLALAFAGAFLLRFDTDFNDVWCMRMLAHLPFALLVEYGCLFLFGATRGAWRFISITDVTRILVALFVAQLPFIVERLVLGFMPRTDALQFWLMPFGIIAINFVLSVITITGMRVLRRMIYEKSQCRSSNAHSEPTVLICSGVSCKQIISSVKLHPELPFHIIGFISDDNEDIGREIAGVPFLGNVRQLPAIAQKRHIVQAVISLPEHQKNALRDILDACVQASLKTRIIPQMSSLLSGQIDLTQMREISVENLLHREPVTLDKNEISQFLSGRRILISGAGGSIGSELCRQVLNFHPAELVLLERCEFFLYEIERELRALSTQTRIIPRLADICDVSRLNDIFAETRPDVVFHAAAYKHVPMLEYNPGEAIRNNIEGTQNIADAAVQFDVSAFVMISTDKAVNPTSIMGTSKRIAERYIQAMSALGQTRFCAVRFGNVLGSTGSVLPLFKKQISAGGPVTVTHADMVRYFMTIPEASQLVMQAATMASNGEIFVLDMGKPVKIVDLARDLIRLSGKTERDIPIVFSGTRPGEKLFEELGFDEERMDHTRHPKIYVGKLTPVALDDIRQAIQTLLPLRDSQDNDAVRQAMKKIVPEMQPPAE